MSEEKKKNSTAKKSQTSKKTAVPAVAAPEVEEKVMPVAAPATAEKPKVEKRKPLPKVDLNELVEVESCFHGELYFESPKTGNKANWGYFGAVDYLTVEDLMSMRNTQPAFFRNNWIMLVGDNAQDVFDYLQLGRFYKNYRSVEDFAELFAMAPEDLAEAMAEMNKEAKENVARHAYSLMQDGELDSVRLIEVIEKATGFNLRE